MKRRLWMLTLAGICVASSANALTINVTLREDSAQSAGRPVTILVLDREAQDQAEPMGIAMVERRAAGPGGSTHATITARSGKWDAGAPPGAFPDIQVYAIANVDGLSRVIAVSPVHRDFAGDSLSVNLAPRQLLPLKSRPANAPTPPQALTAYKQAIAGVDVWALSRALYTLWVTPQDWSTLYPSLLQKFESANTTFNIAYPGTDKGTKNMASALIWVTGKDLAWLKNELPKYYSNGQIGTENFAGGYLLIHALQQVLLYKLEICQPPSPYLNTDECKCAGGPNDTIQTAIMCPMVREYFWS